jgi:L,D-transpeptidase YcbB
MLKPRFSFLIFLTTLVIGLTFTRCTNAHSEEYNEQIHSAEEVFRARFENEDWADLHPYLNYSDEVREIYALNNQNPLWIEGNQLNADGEWFKQFLQRPYFHHWLHDVYDFSPLDTCTNLWKTEVLLTDYWLWIQADFMHGLLADDFTWKKKANELTKKELKTIYATWKNNKLDYEERLLESVRVHPMARNIQKGLLTWTDTAVVNDKLIRVYSMKIDSVLTYQKTRQILALNGYLSSDSLIADSLVLQAIQTFQAHAGLLPDGQVGHYTATALSETNVQRFWRAQLTLQKWRIKEEFPHKYVLVNIPSYTLRFFDADTLVRSHRVIVGTKVHRTPVFTAKMRTVVTYPYWNVPYSIATQELLPSIKKNPGYIRAKDYKLFRGTTEVDPYSVDWSTITRNNFPFRLRQEGGTSNALGLIKLLFPNENNVYIHDTPTKPLFARDIRAFSHGCIRCQDPIELGLEVLIRDGNKLVKNRQDIDSLIALKREIHIRIRDPFDVFIEYFSVEADETGRLTFFVDVYERDKPLLSILEEQRKLNRAKPAREYSKFCVT